MITAHGNILYQINAIYRIISSKKSPCGIYGTLIHTPVGSSVHLDEHKVNINIHHLCDLISVILANACNWVQALTLDNGIDLILTTKK